MHGWKRYKNDPDPRLHKRLERETRTIKTAYGTLLWAMDGKRKTLP